MKTSNNNRRELLAKYCQMPIENVDLLSGPIDVLPDGLVFLMAYWSGPALESFWLVARAMNQQPETFPVLHVLDIDECEGVLRSQLPGNSVITGAGELLIVRNGKAVDLVYPMQLNFQDLLSLLTGACDRD